MNKVYLGAGLLGLISLSFVNYVEQGSFLKLLIHYGLFFAVYLFFLSRQALNSREFNVLIITAVVLRVLFLPAFPNLSDDIYRFIWDGRLINSGIHPFLQLPSYWINESTQTISGIDADLYTLLNSKEYFTIYPPVCQAIFAVSTYLFPNSVLGSMIVMKSFFLLAELGTLALAIRVLRHFRLPPANVLWYALNPLIVLDAYHNLHFEIISIFFIVAALYALVKNRPYLSALAIALAISTKLLPLIFLPFLIHRLGWRKASIYFLSTGVFILLLFLPLFNLTVLQNFSQSLDLYFQRFEFNASLYYIARWVGYQFVGYNLIAMLGPLLALVAGTSILVLALFNQLRSLQSLPIMWMLALCIFLLCTTTVHPWYVSTLLLLCIFSSVRFPILWSGLIVLTYINYSYSPYHENLWIVALEYSAVAAFVFYEYWKWKKQTVASSSSEAML